MSLVFQQGVVEGFMAVAHSKLVVLAVARSNASKKTCG
jgi:hypothetical protein